jgi:hypothetical protein
MIEAPTIDRLLADPDGGQAWGFFLWRRPADDPFLSVEGAGR